MSEYTTKSVSTGVARVRDIVLQEEPMARLVFRPLIHEKGVKGRIVRQRRLSKDDSWSDDTAIDIRTLDKGQSFNVEISTAGVKKFASAIKELSQIVSQNGIDYGLNNYKTVKSSAIVVDSKNVADLAQQIIEKGYSKDVLNAFLASENLDTESIVLATDRKNKQLKIAQLNQRLDEGQYAEVSGDDSWQKFILNNNWMFGANYLEPLDRTKINLDGSMPDFIYPTADGFIDILEIKLPEDPVIIEDKSHTGSWHWSRETNKSIGQATNYIDDMTRLRLEIEKKISDSYGISVSVLKPRAFILIGNSKKWTAQKKQALRRLNSALHEIEVLTYNDLVIRAEKLANL